MDGRFYITIDPSSAIIYSPENEVWLKLKSFGKEWTVDEQMYLTHLIDLLNLPQQEISLLSEDNGRTPRA